ncbi:hypothetical protein DPEC_G00270430 [Dallia pectoralis]|uniref:Uncharacterized protein n=1 Tax=Dallia pectoralis TaxID=75939 RepID=A0ACC2FPM0_DALPE|nr:hypothetical protein DPEC_G00270430 [Dallia pectoralis]
MPPWNPRLYPMSTPKIYVPRRNTGPSSSAHSEEKTVRDPLITSFHESRGVGPQQTSAQQMEQPRQPKGLVSGPLLDSLCVDVLPGARTGASVQIRAVNTVVRVTGLTGVH